MQYWWIPLAIIMYSSYAYLTKQNNLHQTSFWFWLMWAVGAIPLWNFVSRKSTQILIDGFIYDIIIISAYVGTLILLGEAKAFVPHQWLGLVLCLVGLILMKLS